MKNFFPLSIAVVSVALISCQKQQTEAEKNAEIERQVQERLAAEHQADQEKALNQRQADIEAREKALADKENAAATPSADERNVTESYESRAREPRAARESGPSRGYSTFYTKLESYGDWIETGDYGYVFHPREAESSRNWRPYTNGRWVYTDAGWTWISEEPFGWATYHYGRWTRLRGIGWVWVPGEQWAPAWVSWRKSNDYVGWAPLPPEARFDQRSGIHNWADNYYDIGPDQYCFVASREFGAPRVEQTLLPSERNVTIVNQTTNVTNITYNNTTIVNEGPNYDELRSISREPVQRYRLERNVNVDVSVEPPRSRFQGETVVIAAPVIAAPRPSERPPSVKQTVAQVAVDLGWAAIANQEEAKKARQKMKSEATPPPNAPPKKFEKTAAAPATQAGATSVTSTSTAAPSATASATTAPSVAPSATAAPTTTPRMTPHRAVTPAATATASAPSSSVSSPSASVAPTASQRRGRLLVPSATSTASGTPSAAPSATSAPSITPNATPTATVRANLEGLRARLTPAPGASAPISEEERKPGHFKSQSQRLHPRKVEPLPPASPSPSAGSTTSPGAASTPAPPTAASSPSATAVEKLSKQEKKEQKREEKREMKRERREGNAPASPTATP